MKVGDKVVCIDDLIRDNDKQKYIVVLKGRKYTILEINLDVQNSYIKTTSENGMKFWGTTNSGPYYMFSHYLMLEKELRKEKLKKLNESR